MYAITSFFFVVSIAFHQSVPALLKSMYTSRKKIIWLNAHPLMHRLLHLFVGRDRFVLITSLSDPKTWKPLETSSREYEGCGRHSKYRSWIVAKVKWAVCGWTLSCWCKTSVLKSPRCLDLIAGRRWFFRRSAYVAVVTVFHLGVWCSKITPRSFQKRVSINFSAHGFVRNYFRFGEEVWRHSLLAFLVSGWW